MMNSRERRLSLWSNATCATPSCEALPSRRGPRAHHAQKDRVGSWDIPRLALCLNIALDFSSADHAAELQSHLMLVCRHLLEEIKAVWQPNKAEGSAAELVDRRA